VVFVLATTDPQRVLPTILSRCQRFDFRRIPLEALEHHLAWIAEREEIIITPEALHLVAQRAQGGLRDAESLLDQLSLLPPPIEAAAVWDLLGAVPEEELLTLAQAMAAGEPLGVVETSRHLLERGRDPSAVLQGIVGLLRDLLLAGVAPERLELTSVSPPLRSQLPALAREIGKNRLLQWHAALKGSEQQLRHSVQPRLWLEVILLGLLAEAAGPTAARTSGSAGGTVTDSLPSGRASGPGAPGAAAPGSTAPASGASASGGASSGAQPSDHWDSGVAPSMASASTSAAAAAAGRAAASPAVHSQVPAPPKAEGELGLDELWQRILAGLQLPSTRMLLTQQARLKRLDDQRAVVGVTGNWIGMVQSRLALLEKAMESALGSPRKITLEASDQPEPPAAEQVLPSSAPSEPVASEATPMPQPLARPAPAPPPTPAPLDRTLTGDPPTPAPQTGPTDRAFDGPTAGPQAQAEPVRAGKLAPGGDDRLLEESTNLLADFFHGQVIAPEPQEET
jgi:DNA polymerase-3 subunit gamma/tau